MEITRLKNKYHGERIFLIGNGPSIKKTPLEMLEDEYTLGMNKINILYEETNWRPSFYLFVQNKLTEERRKNVHENIANDTICIISSDHRDIFEERDGVYYVNVIKLKNEGTDGYKFIKNHDKQELNECNISQLRQYWSDQVNKHLFSFHSMYSAFQLSSYMGFDKIYLVGCDLGFGVHNPHMIFDTDIDPLDYSDPDSILGAEISYLQDSFTEGCLTKSLINGMIYRLLTSELYYPTYRILDYISEISDSNHFSSNYRKRPTDLRHIDEEIRKSHIISKRILNNDGVEVYNSTIGGELEVYQRKSIQEVVR